MKSAYPVSIQKLNTSERRTVDDVVAIEEPLEIRVAFSRRDTRRVQPVAITMRTPGDDFNLAIGFLLTERIIGKRSDVESVEYCDDGKNENVVRVSLRDALDVDLKKLQRNFYVTSSCGVCGKASIEALALVGYETMPHTVSIAFDTLKRLPAVLRESQSLFQKTGGLHAAGLFSADGDLVRCAEDVGRHNAVDKVLGSRFRTDEAASVLLLSGRASFELVQKALAARIEVVAAVGAPSSLAVQTAESFGITLVGFLSEERANIYSHPRRLI